jgi:ATP-dependent Clp protease ATP-binding subunit ClpX
MPTWEEFLKDMDALKHKYGDDLRVQAFQSPDVTAASRPTDAQDHPLDLHFDLKPKDIKAYLDRYAIQQDEAKKALAIALCDHYNHAMACERDPHLKDEEYAKPNMILMGPTGVGKTYLVRLCAKLLGVPMVKADATKFSETGYVGGNVEDLVRDLVTQANGDVRLASYGIIYLDEIDKIATPSNIIGRDVSGRGVQMGLLKLLEETEVGLRAPYDIQAQMQTMLELQQKGKVETQTLNTRHILFIVSGAFNGLKDIIRQRLHTHRIGFGAALPTKDDEPDYLRAVTSQDLVDFGFEPEFIGRLPVHVALDPLSEDDLYTILKQSAGSIIKQYQQSFSAYGIEVLFSDAGLRRLAHHAYLEHTGARGLITVCERTLRDFKFELPSTPITQCVITEMIVDNPKQELQRVIEDPRYNQQLVARELLMRYAADYQHRYGITLHFNDTAADTICQRAVDTGILPQDLCNEFLKSYEYGLNLIKRNTGQAVFVITPEVLQDPEGVLERWIRDSYARRGEG